MFFQVTELGSNKGDMEVAYLMIIPLNGDPIEVKIQTGKCFGF
jgi:hypothetical protein